MRVKLFIIIALLLVAFSVKSQTKHFIFIQTDDNQPFYVKTDSGLYSSNNLGALIIPNLEESSLKIVIGFPQNKWKSIKYTIAVKSKDLAFILKKSSENQWSMYDYYTLTLIEKSDTSTSVNYPSKFDAFSSMLALVSNVNLDVAELFQDKPSDKKSIEVVSLVKNDSTLKRSKEEVTQLKQSVANEDSTKSLVSKVCKKDTILSLNKTLIVDTLIIASKKKDTVAAISKARVDFDTSIIVDIKKIDSTNRSASIIQLKDTLVVSRLLKQEDTSIFLINHDSIALAKKNNLVKDSSEFKKTAPKSDTLLSVAKIDVVPPIIKTKIEEDSVHRIVVNKQLDTALVVTKTDPPLSLKNIRPLLDTVIKDSAEKIVYVDTIKKTDSVIVSSASQSDSLKYNDTTVFKKGIAESVWEKNKIVLNADTIKIEVKKDSNALKNAKAELNNHIDIQKDTVEITGKKPEEVSASSNGRTDIISDKKELVFIESVSIQQSSQAPIVDSNSAVDISDSLKHKEIEQIKDTIQFNKIEEVKNEASLKENCVLIADDNDFIQLRKQMVGAEDEATMVTLAVEVFRKKCFTCLQIRNLAVLFLNDKGKYKFLEKAYSYISDKDQFQSLQNLLTDEKVIDSFKQLLNNK